MVSYLEFARQVLMGETLEDKLIDVPIEWTPHQDFNLPERPGRKGRLSFSEEQIKFPRASSLGGLEKKAIALNSFANHELLAIEMMAAAILIYPHRTEEDIRFKKGVLGALKDEQKHLSLYIKRLNELGHGLGDFPLNDFFWRQMPKLKTPAQYLAVMSLTFEAANLDFAQYYAKIFREHDDLETARILEIVLEDEMAHVSFGAHWLKRWRKDKALWQYYLESLPWPMTPARGKGLGFDIGLREKTIADGAFISELTDFKDDFSITKRQGP